MRMVAPALALALTGSVFGAGAALADHGPRYVVPGAPGVPVVINGSDASWAVVEGDFGLHRPGHGGPTVMHGAPIFLGPPVGAYYPSLGRAPRLGRHEILPPPRRRPSTRWHRSWTSQSGQGPVTVHPPYDPIPLNVTMEPRRRDERDARSEGDPRNRGSRRNHRY